MTNNADKIYNELLVLRCQAGEQMALTILVERWQMPLIKFASIVCRDNDKAQEAVQDAWIAIIRGLKNLHDASLFKHWALRIVHRKCIDLLRARKNPFPEVELECRPKETEEIEQRDQIEKVLISLTENHRSVLALHYLHDMELKEISTLLGIPNGTVKSRLHHAKEAFRRTLEQQEFCKNG